jgi:hypothetical protein
MADSPEDSTSLVDMSHLANMNYDMSTNVHAGMYSSSLGINYAVPCLSNYQSSIPHSCATTSNDGVQAFIPPWQMMPMDEICLISKPGSDNAYALLTPGVQAPRISASDAPSPASVQSARRGSLKPFATMPEQSLATSYDAYQYQPVMSDASSVASRTPNQSFARLALNQSPAQQITQRRQSVDEYTPQQQWDYTTMTQQRHHAYGQSLSCIPPTSYVSCSL